MNKLVLSDLYCADFFDREKMVKLGINKIMQTRVINLFSPHNIYGTRARLGYYTVEILLSKGFWDFLRNRNVGFKVVEAVNLVLRSEGLPELVPPNVEQEKNS